MTPWGRLADRVVRLQASAEFRRAATALPLTRWVARRRAATLFDLCAGFVYSQILLAFVRLDVPRHLLDGPRSLAELAAATGLPAAGAERLLDAAVSLRLATRRGDLYGLGPLGAALVDNPGVSAMIRHHGLLYDDLRDPERLLRGDAGATALGGFWPYAGGGPPDAEVEPYSDLMAASQRMVAEEVLAAYPLRRHRHLLDVGGGNGAFLIAAGQRARYLQLTLFDLPAVADLARRRFADSPVAGRATAVGGDARRDELPTGADLISLIRVLHDHDDADAMALLRAARRALPPGGTLLVAEPMADTPGAHAMGHGYFGFYLLAMGSGRPRSPQRIGAMLRQAGFPQWRLRPTNTPLLSRVITAKT